MMNDNREQQEWQDGQTQSAGSGGNILRTLLLIGAALVLLVVLVNNYVIARIPEGVPVNGQSGIVRISPRCPSCAASSTELTTAQIGQEALAFYNANFEAQASEAVIEDFGCHQEITIYADGRPVRRLSYSNGTFGDLGPLQVEAGS